MTWRVADSLDVLLGEINAAAPGRSKISDGSIGDADHAARDSDHNPWVIDSRGIGVVRARDFTHDPEHGMDGNVLAPQLAALLGKHPALGSGAYVIWSSRIMSKDRIAEGWRPYSGTNAHEHHVHLSVGTSNYDSTAPWGVLQEDDMADAKTQAQLDRIEKLAQKAVNKLDNSAARQRKALEALDELATSVQDDATKAQVRKIKALLEAPEEDA